MRSRELKLDCRHFRSEKPCRFGNPCKGCMHYEAAAPRVLIIKLDALGDVLRTTSVLRGLRGSLASKPHVTWLVDPSGIDLLRHNPMIDVLLSYEVNDLMRLQVERFDLVLSLDKAPRATSVAMLVRAGEKRGFGLNEYGNAFPLNAGAQYAFELGLDDDLKFRQNTRTYQETIFEACGLRYENDDYVYDLSPEGRAFQAEFAARHGLRGRKVVAVNCGGSAAFANKMWAAEQIVDFVRRIRRDADVAVMLCGAQLEATKMQDVVDAVGDAVIHTGLENTLDQFAALMGLADVVVTGDSLGMHLALALGARVVAMFGPTCAQEIELYGRGRKLVAGVECAPCYRRACERRPTCMESIRPETVAAEVGALL